MTWGGTRFTRRPPVPGNGASSAPTTAALRAPLPDPVGKLDVFPHGAGVCVALGAAGDFAGVRFASDVRLHVLGPVTGVVETLVAVLIVACVRLLPGMRPHMQLEVLQTGKRTGAPLHVALVRFLTGVAAEMGDEFIASVKWLAVALAVTPQAAVGDHGGCVSTVQVSHQVGEVGKLHIAVVPEAGVGSQRLHIPHLSFFYVAKMLTAAGSTDGTRSGGCVARAGEEEGRRGRCGGSQSGVDVSGGKCDWCQLWLGRGGIGGCEGGRGGGAGVVGGKREMTTAAITS